MGAKPQRGRAIFYRGSWPLKTPSKDFHLAIGGGMRAKKGFIFHAIIPALRWRIFILSMLESQSWKKQNSNQNVKVEKMVVCVKTFDYYHHKFNFGNFVSCPVKKNSKLKFRSKFSQAIVFTKCCLKSKRWAFFSRLLMELGWANGPLL